MPNAYPPQLPPLHDPADFRRAARNGQGRAILWLRSHDWRPHAATLEELCLHHPALDRQCESERSHHVFALLRLTGDLDRFSAITARGLFEPAEAWDRAHQFQLLRHFAAAGDASARRAMYDRFLGDDGGLVGAYSLIDLDGIDGLIVVLRRFGQYHAQHADVEESDWIITRVQQKFGEETVNAAIAKFAAEDADIRRCLDAIERTRRIEANRRRRRRKTFDAMTVLVNCDPPAVTTGTMYIWGCRASPEKLDLAAKAALAEHNPARLARWLNVFNGKRWPLNHRPLLALADHPDADVADAARYALANLRGNDIRRCALDQLRRNPSRSAIDMLAHTFQPGDEQLIEAAVVAAGGDEEDRHQLDLGTLHVADEHPSPAFESLLHDIYATQRCSVCRGSAYRKLKELGLAPAWLVEEHKFDCVTLADAADD